MSIGSTVRVLAIEPSIRLEKDEYDQVMFLAGEILNIDEINTRSIEDLSGKTYSNEQLFKKTMSLRKKNISEFMKIISRNGLNSRRLVFRR